MSALQEVAREVGAFLWRKRLNLSKRLMMAGPSKYGSLMLCRVVESPPLDSCLIELTTSLKCVELPQAFVRSVKLSLCHVASYDVVKRFRMGKLSEGELLPYAPPEKDKFVVLPSAACIENFIVCMWDMGGESKIKYTSLLRFKELTVDAFDSRLPTSY